jgi:thiamine pyrophosphokinase
MRAVIVASGEVERGDLGRIAPDDMLIAADGGAATLVAAGCRPAVLVGDLDSVPPSLVERLAAEGIVIERHPQDKEASDLELAVARAMRDGAGSVLIIGAFGGTRLDHELAAVLLLADESYRDVDVRAVRGTTTVRAVHAGAELMLEGAIGDLVTLLPVAGDAHGVTTAGLRWSLAGASLRHGRSRGLSNEVVSLPASARLEHGAMLVVETRMTGA